MMYVNMVAVAVKTNGKILREDKDIVRLPFGTEYSFLIKNLNTKRAVFNITLDGQAVVPGGLVLNAGQEVDLERWVKNGNLSEGNKFKFIERTNDIEEYRGVKLEDGVIRIEFQFEKTYNQYQLMQQSYPFFGSVTGGGYVPTSTSGVLRSASINNITAGACDMSAIAQNCASSANTTLGATTPTFNDAGITVPGSRSDQKFSTASWFPTEDEKHLIILKLLGVTPDNKPVIQPVTVDAKKKCTTCGRQNKMNSDFCSKCGTSLKIFA